MKGGREAQVLARSVLQVEMQALPLTSYDMGASTFLSMKWSCTDHVTTHEVITWLSCTDYVDILH